MTQTLYKKNKNLNFTKIFFSINHAIQQRCVGQLNSMWGKKTIFKNTINTAYKPSVINGHSQQVQYHCNTGSTKRPIKIPQVLNLCINIPNKNKVYQFLKSMML